jgi:hypothetical protein
MSPDPSQITAPKPNTTNPRKALMQFFNPIRISSNYTPPRD